VSLDEKLSRAFAAWAEARAQLGRLRAQGAAHSSDGQLAQSPEAAALFDSILEQQAVCTRLWDAFAKLAEESLEDSGRPR
jgi:hypothetical protein